MCKSQLEKKYLKTKTQNNLKLYKKHENFCSKSYKKEKKKILWILRYEKRFGQ